MSGKNLTPSVVKSVNFRDEKCTYTRLKTVYLTVLFSILCILVEVLSRAHAKEEKSLNDLKFGTVVGRFASGTLASMAVKGLRQAISECL